MATIDNRVIGFVTVHNDEVEQMYVAAEARGGGTATALLQHAEEVIVEKFDLAWLAVVAGNARAHGSTPATAGTTPASSTTPPRCRVASSSSLATDTRNGSGKRVF